MPTNVSKQPSDSSGTSAGSPGLHYVLHNDPQSSHQQIAHLVRRIGCGPVLDVGAAQGLIGQLLQDDGLTVDAVEPHPLWAEHARPFYRTVYATGIEDAPLAAGTYATVVCADVLEHTADPVTVLRKLRQAATPDATFLISLPNIAHIAARGLLLFGRFPQMERGIFDRTHLHFYTRDTVRSLLADAGLELVRIRPTPVPLRMAWPQGFPAAPLRALMALQRVALLLSPTLFGFQWVVVARAANKEAAQTHA